MSDMTEYVKKAEAYAEAVSKPCECPKVAEARRNEQALAVAREILDRLDRLETVVGSHEAILRALIEHHNNVTAVLVMQQQTIRNMLGIEPKPPTSVN